MVQQLQEVSVGAPTAMIRFNDEWHGTSSRLSNHLRTQLYLRSWFEKYSTKDDKVAVRVRLAAPAWIRPARSQSGLGFALESDFGFAAESAGGGAVRFAAGFFFFLGLADESARA